MKFSVSIDRNNKGAPKIEFISLIFVARGPIFVLEDAQGKMGSFHNFRGPTFPLSLLVLTHRYGLLIVFVTSGGIPPFPPGGGSLEIL